MLIKADFHIHTCLSPCGSLEMSPKAIVQKALDMNLNLIAISDHNSGKNCPVFSKICADNSIYCLFGIEVSTREEVHCLCLFDDLNAVMELDRYIFQLLPVIRNIPDKFGDQVVVNEQEEIIEEITKFLGNAVKISIDELNILVLKMGGLFIPAHVNRNIYSLESQLGFIPEKERYSAVEIYRTSFIHGRPDIPVLEYPVVSNSDAHYLEQIGTIWNEFELDDISIKNIAKVFDRKLNKILFNSSILNKKNPA